MFPSHAVGSVVGIGGMAGALGGIIVSKVAGYTLEATGTCLPMFVLAGSSYLVAWTLIQLLAPTLESIHGRLLNGLEPKAIEISGD